MSDFLTQFPKTQGERIAALRQARDLSQRQLAEAIKCHKNSVSKWEGEKPIDKVGNVIELANYFGVSTDYLLCLTDVPNRADMPAPEVPVTATGRAFDELARQIAQRYPDALLLFARPFSDAELEMLTGAFRSVAAHRAEVAAEVEAARKTVPLDADPPLGMADGKDHVG